MLKCKEFLNVSVDPDNGIHVAFLVAETPEFKKSTASLRICREAVDNIIIEKTLPIYGREHGWLLYLDPEEKIELSLLGLEVSLTTDSDIGTATVMVSTVSFDAIFLLKEIVTTTV
jgi:hypothetical protein